MFESYGNTIEDDRARRYALCLRAATGGQDVSASSPVDAMQGGQGSFQQRGMGTAQEQYRNFRGQVYTTIRPIAQTIAGQPIRLARRVEGKRRRPIDGDEKFPDWVVKSYADGDPTKLEPIEKHDFLKTLAVPNSMQVDWMLIYSLVCSLELTGWGFLWCPKTKGKRELWAVPTNWVTAVRDQAKRLIGWRLKPDGSLDEGTPVPLSEMVVFNYPNPADPMAALAPLEANSRAAIIDQYIEEAQKNGFERGIHPRMAVFLGETTGKLGGGKAPRTKSWQRNQIRARINARLRGVGKYGEHIICDRYVKDVRPITNKIAEMDFPESAKMSQGRVSRGWGVNPTITGDNDGVNYAQATVAEDGFARRTINPKLTLLSRCATARLLPLFDSTEGLIVYWEPLEVSDPQLRASALKTALDKGTITVNEYNKAALGMADDPTRNYFLRPSTVTAYGADAKPVDDEEGDDDETPAASGSGDGQDDPIATDDGEGIATEEQGGSE